MKRKFILLPIFLFVCSLLFGQNIDKLSFVVNGQFDSINSNDKYFYLSFINEDNKEIIDSAKKLSPTGKFSLTGYIRKPVLAKLYTHRAILGELIIGPGFNLDITGDAKNFNVLSVTKKIIGNGSAPNQYIVKRDSVLYKLNIDVGLLQLKEDDFQKMISTRKKICDSVLSVVFNLGSPASAYLNIKKDIIKEEGFDNAVNVINYLINHPNFNYRYTVLFAKNNISEVILKDIYDEDNLRYPGYINLMGAYYFYLEALDSRKNNLPPVDFDDAIKHLETIASSYQGKIKFSTLSGRMHYALVFCRSYPEFELYNSTFPNI